MTSAATAQSVRYREYETIYLMRPNVTKDAAARVAKRIEDVVERLGGKLTQVETWGRRQLSYTIKSFRRAVYVYVKYVAGPDMVAELERNLRMIDDVIKFQTVLRAAHVDLGELTIDPEAVKFEEIDLPEEVEDERLLERELGFVEPEPRPRRTEEDLGEDMDGDEYPADEKEDES